MEDGKSKCGVLGNYFQGLLQPSIYNKVQFFKIKQVKIMSNNYYRGQINILEKIDKNLPLEWELLLKVLSFVKYFLDFLREKQYYTQYIFQIPHNARTSFHSQSPKFYPPYYQIAVVRDGCLASHYIIFRSLVRQARSKIECLEWIHYHQKLRLLLSRSHAHHPPLDLLIQRFLSFIVIFKFYSILLLTILLFYNICLLDSAFDWFLEVFHWIGSSFFVFIQNHAGCRWLESKSTGSTSDRLLVFYYQSDQILSFLAKIRSTLIEIREYFLLDSKSYQELIQRCQQLIIIYEYVEDLSSMRLYYIFGPLQNLEPKARGETFSLEKYRIQELDGLLEFMKLFFTKRRAQKCFNQDTKSQGCIIFDKDLIFNFSYIIKKSFYNQIDVVSFQWEQPVSIQKIQYGLISKLCLIQVIISDLIFGQFESIFETQNLLHLIILIISKIFKCSESQPSQSSYPFLLHSNTQDILTKAQKMK